jgi:hypothetical protein
VTPEDDVCAWLVRAVASRSDATRARESDGMLEAPNGIPGDMSRS